MNWLRRLWDWLLRQAPINQPLKPTPQTDAEREAEREAEKRERFDNDH